MKLKYNFRIFFISAALLFLCIEASNLIAQTNNALDFDGSNDFVICSSINPAAFTAEAWVCPNTQPDQAVFSTLSVVNTSGFELHIGTDGIPLVTMRNGSSYTDTKAASAVTMGLWVHLAVTFDGSSCKLYVNGVLSATSTISSFTAGSNAFNIGRRADGGCRFNGKIDEVRVWNNARSIDQIKANMNVLITNPGSVAELLAYFPFDQGVAEGNNTSVTILNDLSSKAQNGSLTNFALTGSRSNWVGGCTSINIVKNLAVSPSLYSIDSCATIKNITVTSNTDWAVSTTAGWVTFNQSTGQGNGTVACSVSINNTGVERIAKIIFTGANAINDTAVIIQAPYLNNALSFDGGDDYVLCNSINPAVFTIEAWVNPVTFTDQAVISTLSAITNAGMELHVGSSGNPILTVRNGTSWTNTTATSAIKLGRWTHLAGTFDGSVCKIYINGILAVTSSTISSFNAGSNAMNIGRRSDGGCRFNGIIDEVRVWNTIRTPSEIYADLKEETTSVTGLMAYYNFNQGIAYGNNPGVTSLADGSGNTSNGILNNFALTGSTSNWVKGCNGKILYIDAITSLDKLAGATQISITSTVDWTITGSASWLTFNPTAGSNIVNVSALREANSTLLERTSTVKIAGAGVDKVSLTFTQAAGSTGNNKIVTPEVIVYPNPAKDYVTVKGINGEAKIVNLNGQLIMTYPIKGETTIPINKLQKGIYFISIDKYQKKIVIE
jgi:hypothetical protein